MINLQLRLFVSNEHIRILTINLSHKIFCEIDSSTLHTFFIFQGKCLGQGTFDEMSQSGIDFSSLLKRDKEEEEVKEEEHHQEVSYHIANAKLANIGSMMSLTSIGTEFEVS